MKVQATPNQHFPLVAQDLDQVECSNPHCAGDHPLFFHPMCHPNAGVAISYVGEVLTIQCHACRQLVVKVKVARAEVQ